jgi:hypothetical protein
LGSGVRAPSAPPTFSIHPDGAVGASTAPTAPLSLRSRERPDGGGGVIRDSTVVAQTDDPHRTKGIRLAVRIQDDQDIVDFSIGGFPLWPKYFKLSLEKDLIATFKPKAGEKWVGLQIPRAHVPNPTNEFRTTFHLTPAPSADQRIRWVVVYDDESFKNWHADGESIVHPV